MGFLISKMLDSLSSKQNYRILMLGLDGAGKTTILFNMKLGEVIKSVPTIGSWDNKASIMKQWSIRTLNSRYGMLEVKIRSGLCGNTISRTQKR